MNDDGTELELVSVGGDSYSPVAEHVRALCTVAASGLGGLVNHACRTEAERRSPRPLRIRETRDDSVTTWQVQARDNGEWVDWI